ncbi:MAG: outer membrane protein assembly factor BamD [Nitrospira sp.]|nr:outer membrane protein assembly factor BamD [Nitrospira sp.]
MATRFPSFVIKVLQRSTVLSLCTILVCAIPACSGTPKPKDGETKPLRGTDEHIFVGDTIEKNYDPNVIMKRGEAYFEKEEYTEAIVEFNHFLELHRTHILASYAAFRVGESQMKRAKGIERDPDPIQKAIEAFERLRKEFPGSRYDGQALQKIEECHDLLAQTHLLVGQFYYRRSSYLAAAHRFNQIVTHYPDKSVAADAVYFLARTYHDFGADDWASEQLTLLEKKYPNSAYASEGRSLLAKINKGRSAPLQAEPAAGSKTLPTFAAGMGTSPTGSLQLPSATALRQSFVVCRIGAWC